MKAGRYDAACPKLEAAAKLYTGSGVLLNLADCYEHTHRYASAWNEFGAASEAAARTGRADDEAEGKRRQQALEPLLSRLIVHVAHDVPGLVVTRNGAELEKGAWDVPIPVDPGTYSVTATATRRESWSGSVSVSDASATVTIDVPLLRVDDDGPQTATSVETTVPSHDHPHDATLAPQRHWTGGRVAAAVLTGVGIAGMGIGGVMSLSAKSTFDRAEGETGATQRTDSSRAVSAGNVATGVVVGGAVIAAVGVTLWFALPDNSAVVGTDGHALFLRGAF